MKSNLFAAAIVLCIFSLPVTAASAPPTTTQNVKKINLNTADAKTLSGSFQRIGKTRAEAIVKYRQTHGNFKSVAELAQVHGLGQAFVMSHLQQLQAVFEVI